MEKVVAHLNLKIAVMPLGVAAQFDTGDLGDSDPGIRAANVQQ